ncbi:MAG: DUF5716 family protein [Candidatus Choladocola sp.]|nr:DUF5716 family protein [Candidatus Choladocola sp.]
MVQATNELILGIDLNEQYAQLTYYHQSVREPLTVGLPSDPEQIQFPMAMRQDSQGQWKFWTGEPEQDDGEPDRCRICGIYEKIQNQEAIEDQGQSFEPAEILAIYFGLCMSTVSLLTQNTRVQVMVTVRELTERWSDVLSSALEKNGIDRKLIYMQDYLSSFYYYTVNQKKELWYQDVALLEYEEEAIVGYVLHIDRSTRPAIAKVDMVARQSMDDTVRDGRDEPEWKKEKDRLFFELLKKVFERRNISVSYLLGDYFNKSWAERSIQYLCYKRHAFQGKNLYSKGACYAAMERAGLIAAKGIIFGGRDMIQVNLGMDLCIRGKETYYPLVNAGINWYEAHHVCEFILHGEREIRVTSRPMTKGEPTVHMLRLTGLPPRPDRATRLRLTVYFTAPGKCHLEVEDLGFGEFYRPCGLTWQRDIFF